MEHALTDLTEGGDCEDFAILKMESLKYLGWREEQFAVVIGFTQFTRKPQSHAVLLATLPDGSQVLMDSLEDQLELPREDHHFSPMYAVTREHIWHVASVRDD